MTLINHQSIQYIMNTTPLSKNSKIVTIYRKESFLNNAQRGTALEFVAMAKRSLGSYWENSFSKTVGSGLSFDEQKILMPSLVDCEPEDRMFRSKVAEYFSSMKTEVPYDKGRQLEIGLEESNSKPVSATNQPLNLADYVTYRHALRHPLVAKSKEEAASNMLAEYYIFDSATAEKDSLNIETLKDLALEKYMEVKETPEKIDMLLTMLLVDPREYRGANAAALKLKKLRELTDQEPKKFIDAFEDNLLAERYNIQTMINTGVLTKVGEKIIDPESGVTLGHNMIEAIAYMKDEANNSEKIVILKAKMQEALTKPMPATFKANK